MKVEDVDIPTVNDSLEGIELEYCKKALCSVEAELAVLQDRSSPLFDEAKLIYEMIRNKHREMAEQEYNLRCDLIDKLYEAECDKARTDTDTKKKALRDRINAALIEKYQQVLSELHALNCYPDVVPLSCNTLAPHHPKQSLDITLTSVECDEDIKTMMHLVNHAK